MTMSDTLNIVFFGSSQFVVDILKDILKTQKEQLPDTDSRTIHLLGIVSQPDTILRGKIIRNPVSQFAFENNIICFSPEKINRSFDEFQKLFPQVDICIVASFGQIISQKLLDYPTYGFINWHPSNLPKYRGATPLQSVLVNGEKITALSWIIMTKEMDAGDILLQTTYIILPNQTFPQLASAMQDLGCKTWKSAIINRINGTILGSQDNSKVTFCGKISKEDSLSNLKMLTADELYNKWRGFYTFPGIKIEDNQHFNSLIKLISVDVPTTAITGTVEFENKIWLQIVLNKQRFVYLKCASETFLPVTEIGLGDGKRIKLSGYIFKNAS
jgi:methionyl-tRNA formyltransferase